MKLDPALVLKALTTNNPVRLVALPRGQHGIYALHDHRGAIRYIGRTNADKDGFYGRIHGRHVRGSEDRSHKFSRAYNTGRMWRAERDKSTDARLAKRLRSVFIRRYCHASIFAVPSTLWGELPLLEARVKSLAPEGMDDWGDKRAFPSLPEPRELVDAVIEQLGFTLEQRSAVERQAAMAAHE